MRAAELGCPGPGDMTGGQGLGPVTAGSSCRRRSSADLVGVRSGRPPGGVCCWLWVGWGWLVAVELPARAGRSGSVRPGWGVAHRHRPGLARPPSLVRSGPAWPPSLAAGARMRQLERPRGSPRRHRWPVGGVGTESARQPGRELQPPRLSEALQGRRPRDPPLASVRSRGETVRPVRHDQRPPAGRCRPAGRGSPRSCGLVRPGGLRAHRWRGRVPVGTPTVQLTRSGASAPAVLASRPPWKRAAASASLLDPEPPAPAT